jgi:hypothetical protein
VSDFRWTRREKPLPIWYTPSRRSQEEEMIKRYFGKCSALLLFLSVTSCKSYQWSGSYSVSCNGSLFGSATQCTVSFTSANPFDWTASSTLDGVTIQPSSGTEAAGKSSGDIHVTLPSDACPGSSGVYAGSLNFTDAPHDLQLSFKIVGSGGGGCTLKS